MKKCTIRIPLPSLPFSIFVVLSHLPMTNKLPPFLPTLSLTSTNKKSFKIPSIVIWHAQVIWKPFPVEQECEGEALIPKGNLKLGRNNHHLVLGTHVLFINVLLVSILYGSNLHLQIYVLHEQIYDEILTQPQLENGASLYLVMVVRYACLLILELNAQVLPYLFTIECWGVNKFWRCSF